MLGRFPRQPGTLGDEAEAADIGTIQAHVDGPREFAIQSEYRKRARESYIKYDCGSRVQRALLRNAKPIPGPYKVGDVVSYRRDARQGETGVQWSVASRIVGFEHDDAYPDRLPAVCWVICDGIPVCVSVDKIRPCTAAELLAYQLTYDPSKLDLDLGSA